MAIAATHEHQRREFVRPFWSAMLALTLAVTQANAQTAADGAGTDTAYNLRLVAHDALQARQTYQIVEHHQGNRWLLYLGHMRGRELDPTSGAPTANGTSVVDVTDPAHPRYLTHIPPTPMAWFSGDAEAATGTQHVQVCDGAVLPRGTAGHTYLLRNVGSIAQEVLDVTDPLKPRQVSEVLRAGTPRDGLLRTHKNVWDCSSGMAFLVNSIAGWTGQQLQIVDLADPVQPRWVRDFGLPGTQPGGITDRGEGFSLHEASVLDHRVYLAYGTNHDGVIQILDRDKLLNGDPHIAQPLAPTDDNLRYPEIARLEMPSFWGGHSAKPILGVPIADYVRNKTGAKRNFLFVTSEGIDFRCATPRHIAFFIDMTDERHPWPVSNFQVPALPSHPGDPDFCERGVFGPHSPHASHNPLYEGKLIFLAYFTAGVRVIDMRDPFKPREVGHFIPKATAQSRVIYPPNPPADVKPWPVTNTVEVDERGHWVYAVDRPHNGLFVLELKGEAAKIAAP